MGTDDDLTPARSALTIEDAQSLWDVEPDFVGTCSYGPPPRSGWDALQVSLDQWRFGTTGWQPWAESVQTSRELFARLMGTTAIRVATVAAVSQLLAPLASAQPDGSGVLVPDIELTSDNFPFAVHAARDNTVPTTPPQHPPAAHRPDPGGYQSRQLLGRPSGHRRGRRHPLDRRPRPRGRGHHRSRRDAGRRLAAAAGRRRRLPRRHRLQMALRPARDRLPHDEPR